tara:strand:- start:576 stop:1220 length:645 start_codon:yes stop_codon:yes gene_type:complete
MTRINITEQDYLKRALSLLPPGQMARDLDSNWAKVLKPLASELAKVTERAARLLEEADPRTAIELFEEWEAFAGLPDSCTSTDLTFGERRDALVAKLRAKRNLSRPYYKQLAEGLGYDVVISEYRPMGFGNWGFGANEVYDDHGRYFIGPQTPGNNYQYYWVIHVSGSKYTRFSFGRSAFGDPLLHIRTANDLECKLRKLKPADTHLTFIYEEE